MNVVELITEVYLDLFGGEIFNLEALQQSGSDRKYFRITVDERSIIAVYNANNEENEAFVGFTRHFLSKELQVPEILAYIPEKHIYFLNDLGDVTLYRWLHQKESEGGFDEECSTFYRKVLDKLIQFQITGIDKLDLDLCYPHRSFDRQSMMWDMNYFKYMFLKLLAVPFNERRLELDFGHLSDFLLETKQDYFLYRDFQSANIMVVAGEPWFIDYQGGRKGAPHYDVASLLYDAKAHIPEQYRQDLINYYIKNFCSASDEDENDFRQYFAGFTIIRLMQALGAFGFRGLYEKKPTFTVSIVPAVQLLTGVIEKGGLPVSLPELVNAVNSIQQTLIYRELLRT